ncbi:hypothetical protein WDW37_02680 [Bdellovibrionota bacterium FG-1]
MNRLILAVMVFGVFFVGCAKDRTLDDWKSEHDAEIRAKLHDASDTYRGMLLENSDAAGTIAPLELQINDCAQAGSTAPSSGGTGAAVTQTAVCGYVKMLGDSPLSLAFQNGVYDSVRSEMKVQIPVTGRGTVDIQASLSGQTLYGTLGLVGYPDQAGKFQLVRQGAVPASGALSRTPGVFGGALVTSFCGNPVFNDNQKPSPVEMNIFKAGTVPEQDFTDVLSPVRHIKVTFTTTTGNAGSFPSAVWDLRTKTLTGDVAEDGSGKQGFHLQTECHEIALSGGTGWDCTYASLDFHAGPIFSGRFVPSESGKCLPVFQMPKPPGSHR